MSLEEANTKYEQALQREDVAEKRLLLYRSLEEVLAFLEKDSVRGLDGFDGVLYKASQDFLLASSTMEKEDKMEKILGHVERRYS